MIEVIVKEGIVKKYHYQNKYKTIIQLGLVKILLMKKLSTMSRWYLSTRSLWRLSKYFTTVMSSEQSGEFNISKHLMILSEKFLLYLECSNQNL